MPDTPRLVRISKFCSRVLRHKPAGVTVQVDPNGWAFIKELLRKAWADRLSFLKLDLASPERLPVGPGTVIDDDIAFARAE